MLRLFSGLELPNSIRGALSRLQNGVPQARWIKQRNLHITLCFIGEVEEPIAAAIDETLGSIRQNVFSLSCAGIGAIGSPFPRSLWIGVSDSLELAALQEANVAALRKLGFSSKRRRFRPHVTLARLRRKGHDKVGRWLTDNGLFSSETFAVNHFVLFSSHLDSGEAEYFVERRYPLGNFKNYTSL